MLVLVLFGPLLAWTDDPIEAGVTPIRAVHITELRAAIDAKRAACDLPIRLRDGAQAAGKVLVSDADGNAAWGYPVYAP